MVNSRYRSFRGIPYAAPPLGHLRWRPPAPVTPWQEELDATSYRHNCLQGPDFDPAQPRATLSEDCLYLNLWTPPNANSSSQLPVMVWMHGGGYQGGGANESRLNGTWDASLYNMIVVTTNYRLNIFGFLASQSLRERDPAGSTGNYGILDQRAALRWVQDNIASFGGDPTRVLLAGESAGGASVYNHLVRPNSWGLFSRAAAESGAYTLVVPSVRSAALPPALTPHAAYRASTLVPRGLIPPSLPRRPTPVAPPAAPSKSPPSSRPPTRACSARRAARRRGASSRSTPTRFFASASGATSRPSWTGST